MKLGWELEKSAEYIIGIPKLSAREIEFLEEVFERFKESKNESEEEIARIMRALCAERNILMSKKQFEHLLKIASMQLLGFGILDVLLEDEDLEEIAVIGIGKPIYVFKRNHGWLKTNARFVDPQAFVETVNKMARELGRRLTFQNPRLNAVLKNGARVHASMPPVSDYELTVRRFRSNPISVPELIALRTFSASALAFLSLFMQADASVLICGNTASGKTSTLNALFSFVPLDERVLITEETPELNIPHEHVVKLLANQELGIGMRELVSDALRMRPDRVIVGEVRTGEEAKALIETMLAGQARGCYATFHAQSASDALRRFRAFGILASDLASIDLIVVQRRMLRYEPRSKRRYELRRCVEIAEVEPEKAEARLIFRYDARRDGLLKVRESSVLSRLAESLGMRKRELARELKARESFLRELAEKKLRFDESVREIQSRLFKV